MDENYNKEQEIINFEKELLEHNIVIDENGNIKNSDDINNEDNLNNKPIGSLDKLLNSNLKDGYLSSEKINQEINRELENTDIKEHIQEFDTIQNNEIDKEIDNIIEENIEINKDDNENINEDDYYNAFSDDDINIYDSNIIKEEIEKNIDIDETIDDNKNKNDNKKEFNISSRVKTKQEEFLEKITVDLQSIEIVNNNDIISAQDSIDFILNGEGTYQVIAPQSCYVAFVESLNNADISAITNSTLDVFNSRRKLYQTVWSKINTTSLGKLSFENFLKITSFFDLDTLLYGIYVQTFPGETDFNIKCHNCNGNSTVKINNDSLISIRNDDIYKHFDEITESVTSAKDVYLKSLISKVERIILPKSKIIVDIKIPTLQDHLNILGSIKDKDKAQELEDIVNTLIFIKDLYCMDVKATKESNKAIYFPINERTRLVSILSNMQVEDFKYLNNKITERAEKYSIEYKIKSFKCPKCHREVGDMPVDIERLLFLEISR